MRKITIAGIRRRGGRYARAAARRLGVTPSPPPAPVTELPPVRFERWAHERSAKIKRDHPAPWNEIALPAGPFPQLAVVLHAHFAELVPELLEALGEIPVDFDLLVTNSSGEELDLTGAPATARTVTCLPVENHGRDILPLIHVVNAGLLDPYSLVLKVHTKKSEWRAEHAELAGDGASWRRDLLGSLLGGREHVTAILDAFAGDPTLGTLTSPGSVAGREFWGDNQDNFHNLLRRMQLRFEETRLEFAAGSMYWTRAFLLQGLRGFDLRPEDFEPEQGQVNATTAHAVERLIGALTLETGMRTRDTDSLDPDGPHGDDWRRYSADAEPSPRARVVPFYLPQFHTFPENDHWWGRGFTEWANVVAARPVYQGHDQPFLPGELGFYDLADPSVRGEQYELATMHGVEGFMYYYYWFAGKSLMQKPVEDLVASDDEHPFCIMWANENWSRRWDGGDAEVLIAQQYDVVPATQFIHDVMHLLTDPRYMRIDGRPVIAVYKIAQIPDYEQVVQHWRDAAIEAGLPGLEISAVDVGTSMDGIDGTIQSHGLDSYLEFAPHNRVWDPSWPEPVQRFDPDFQGGFLSYDMMARRSESDLRTAEIEPERFPGVMVGFDNTARRQWTQHMWYGSNPYTFRRWLQTAVDSVMDRDRDRRIVIVNAWNEWAESAVLEPSQRWGRTFLLAVRDVVLR